MPARLKTDLYCYFGRSNMKKTTKQILESASNVMAQVNALLDSSANPSDDTSLSIRLSMVKVSYRNLRIRFARIVSILLICARNQKSMLFAGARLEITAN